MESYRPPEAIGSLIADPPVRKNYYHLESNKALPHPLTDQKISEVKEKYTLQLHKPEEYSQRRGQNLGDRSARNLHNKGTHFVFGSSYNQSTTETVKKREKFSKMIPNFIDLSHRKLSLGESHSMSQLQQQQV